MKTEYLALIAAAALMTVACSKIEKEDYSASDGVVTFAASVEPQADDTKTHLNSGLDGLVWTAGDTVKIYGQSGNADFTASTSGASTILQGDSVGDAPYAAFYPSSFASNYDSSTKTFTVDFAGTQTYAENDIADGSYPMISWLESGSNFGFKNVGSLMCIKLKAAYDNIYVQEIKLSHASSRLSGAATVAWSEGTPSVTFTGDATEANKSIVLDCSAAAEKKGVLINSTNAVSFYIVVPVGEYQNLNITVTGSIQDKTYTASQTLTNLNKLSFARSSKYNCNMTAANLVFDLSMSNGASETANCYLIKEPGKYKFPVTVKGNGVAPNDETTTIETSAIQSYKNIWADGTTFISGDISIADGYATFATEGKSASDLPKGNVLFGIYNAADTPAGSVIWSWHLWANKDVEDVTSTGSSSYTFTNMHLGAYTAEYQSSIGNGFFYQWGRKDPFMQVYGNINTAPWSYQTTTASTVANSVANPVIAYRNGNSWCSETNVNLWSKNGTTSNYASADVEKTMYDPCPPGYHVPSYKALKYIAGSGSTITKTGYTYWVLNGIPWPGAGYRFYGGCTSLDDQGSSDASVHGWSAFADSETTAGDFCGSFAGNTDPFNSFGWYLGFPLRPEKN